MRIQIAVALIAFLLLSLLRKMAQDNQTLLETTQLVRANLMHRRDFTCLKQPQKPPPRVNGGEEFAGPAWRSKSRPGARRICRHEKGPHGAPFHAGGENFLPPMWSGLAVEIILPGGQEPA